MENTGIKLKSNSKLRLSVLSALGKLDLSQVYKSNL